MYMLQEFFISISVLYFWCPLCCMHPVHYKPSLRQKKKKKKERKKKELTFATCVSLSSFCVVTLLWHPYSRAGLDITLWKFNSSSPASPFSSINPLNPELNPICYLLALLAHHFLHVSRIMVKSLPLRLLLSYIYIYIYMERIFLMFLDHTQRGSKAGRTPLDEWSARRRDL